MSRGRRSIFINEGAQDPGPSTRDSSRVQAFHKQLPHFAPTPLISLHDAAKQLGVKAVFVKDESNRLGLSASQILGTSWGAYRAIIAELGLPQDAALEEVARAAQKHSIILSAAIDDSRGRANHGKALAATAEVLGIKTRIYAPNTIRPEAVRRVASHGAEVIKSKSEYDGVVQEAWMAATSTSGELFVQDSSFYGYEQIPNWIAEGFSTLLVEAEQQLWEQSLKPNLVVIPVGVGCLAHGVVSYCQPRHWPVVSVEPDVAACLYKSLQSGRGQSLRTPKTVMQGLSNATWSTAAFADLQAGIHACVTISDYEAHQAVQYLSTRGVESGPSGAASLVALWRLSEMEPRPTYLSSDSVIVLLNTEGPQEYPTPLDVSVDDAVKLTQILTTIDSSNPLLSQSSGAGETEIANYVAAWLEHRDLETHWLEKTPGRPSVVGVLRGKGEGKSLMVNGHIDTVSLSSYAPDLDPLSGLEKDGRVYGRGCLDMKAGVAAGMSALAHFNSSPDPLLRGDVILAAVADEEYASIGTEEVIAAGWRADAAIVTEPTQQELGVAHKGFVWVEIDVLGVAAHGSLPDQGVDAILLSGSLQTALLQYGKTLPSGPHVGQASLHAGLIKGGEEPSSYPALCTLTVEFRTVPSQSTESILSDIDGILKRIASENPAFKYAPPRVSFSRPPFNRGEDDDFLRSFISAVSKESGKQVTPTGLSFWCDAGLLQAAGVSTVVYGPKGAGIHSKEEWVDVPSIRAVAAHLQAVIRDFCS